MGAIVGGVIGGLVFVASAALLAVMWKTGRLRDAKCCPGGCMPQAGRPQDGKCSGGSGGCLPCCGRSETAAVISTQPPALAAATVTDEPVAGAPPASAAKPPPLPSRPSTSTPAAVPSASTAN